MVDASDEEVASPVAASQNSEAVDIEQLKASALAKGGQSKAKAEAGAEDAEEDAVEDAPKTEVSHQESDLKPQSNGKEHSSPNQSSIKAEIEEPKPAINGKKLDLEEVRNSQQFKDLKTAISQKRTHIDNLTQKLAAEEARYTVLKKIRLSQLSTENNKAEEKRKQEMLAQKEAQETSRRHTPSGGSNYNPNNTNRRPKPNQPTAINANNKTASNETSENSTPRGSTPVNFDKSFKPIQPALATNGGSRSTGKVLAPTPISYEPARGKGRPSKNYTAVRDLDDIRQLAAYLAQNQSLSDTDKARARKLVFKKQLGKIIASCPPIETDKPDVVFFPLVNSNEFVNLIGLEQVVNTIKLQNVKKKGGDKVIHGHLDNADDWKVKDEMTPGQPYECENCKTDFTPQWYRNKDKPDDENSVFCLACVQKYRAKANIRSHNRNLKNVFKEAYEYEKIMDQELEIEYEKQVKIYKEDEAKKREDANRQILILQKKQQEEKKRMDLVKQNAEKQRSAAAAKAQAEHIKRLLENQNRGTRGRQAMPQQTAQQQAQARLSSLGSQNIDVIQKLMSQIEKSGVMNNASPVEMNKIIEILTQQMIQAGVQQPQELAELLRVMMQNLQTERKRKQQRETEQQQAQQQARLAQAREAQERREREKRAAEERRKQMLEQEAQRKKQKDTDSAIQQLLNMIANTQDQSQQQQLLQVLLTQTNNNQEAQQRIIDQVVRMITQKNQGQGTSVRR